LRNIVKLFLEPFIKFTGRGKRFNPRKNLGEIFLINFPAGIDFKFIQVGANDGVSFDILYNVVTERKSRGIVIEPLKDFYERLCDNYKDFPEIKKVNKAVHHTDRIVTMYRVDPARQHELEVWTSGIASFDPNHHKKSNTPNSYIVEERVDAAPLMELVEEFYQIKECDLLQIDVEGFDYQVLKTIDFKKLNPVVIKYEYANLPEDEKKKSKQLLKKYGYYLFKSNDDMIGVLLNKVRL
jgi:FkbM family methyltransferase